MSAHPRMKALRKLLPTDSSAVIRDPFEGLPLKAWAEKLGERVMPAYELIKEEQAAAKRAAKAMGKKVDGGPARPQHPAPPALHQMVRALAPCLLP